MAGQMFDKGTEKMKVFYNHELEWEYDNVTFQMDTDYFWELADKTVKSYNDHDQRLYKNMKRRIKQAEKNGIHFVENVFEEYLVVRKVVNDSFAEYKSVYPFWGRGSYLDERFMGLALSNARHFVHQQFDHYFSRGQNREWTIDIFFRLLDDYDICEALFNRCWMGEEESED